MAAESATNQPVNNPSDQETTRRAFLALTAALPAASALGALAWADLSALAADATAAAAANPISLEKLHAEFAEECQIGWKYLAFALKAEAEGYPRIARLFRAVADAERIHANILLHVMSAVKSTKENLQLGADYEAFLIEGVFPQSIDHAQKDHDPVAELTFHRFLGAGYSHHDVFATALAAVKDGKDLADLKITVCPVCGNVMLGAGPEVCPVCRTEKLKFLAAK
jgi:rubrerythrin